MKFPKDRPTLFAGRIQRRLFSSGAHAQDSDYARVVRLSRTTGKVLVSTRGQRLLGRCPGNLPLAGGDTLETQGGLG